MLRYSTQAPSVPIVQYDPGNPPFYPSPPPGCLEELKQYIGQVTVALINTAGSLAWNNAARMYCYNSLIDNNWSNEFFSEALYATMGVIGMKYKENPSYPIMSHIKPAAEHALVLLTSLLPFREQELKSLLTSQFLNQAERNVMIYEDLKKEISMYNTMMPMGAPSAQVNVVQTQQGMVLQVTLPTGQQVMFQIMQQQPNQTFVNINGNMLPFASTQQGYVIQVNNQWVPAAAFFTQMAMGGQQQQQQMAFQQQQQQPQMAFSGTTFVQPSGQSTLYQTQNIATPGSDRWGNGESVFDQAVQAAKNNASPLNQTAVIDNRRTQQQTALPAAVEQKSADAVIEVMKGKNMTSKNTVILGKTYNLDTVSRQDETRTAIRAMSLVKDENAEDNKVLYPSFLHVADIDEAFTAARLQQMTAGPEAAFAYRVFGSMLRPIFSKAPELPKYIETIRKSLTFHEIANRIKSVGLSLSSPELKDKDMSDLAISVSTADMVLTEIVNRYLRCNMGLVDKVNIDNFSEDIAELPGYLLKSRNEKYVSALEHLETLLIESFNISSNGSEKLIIEGLDAPDGVHTALLPLAFSLTSIGLTSSELGFVMTRYPIVVDRNVAPEIHRLCETLRGHKKIMLGTLDDFLMTSDDVRFRIYENVIDHESYMLERM